MSIEITSHSIIFQCLLFRTPVLSQYCMKISNFRKTFKLDMFDPIKDVLVSYLPLFRSYVPIVQKVEFIPYIYYRNCVFPCEESRPAILYYQQSFT